jgi:hypothetical protein
MFITLGPLVGMAGRSEPRLQMDGHPQLLGLLERALCPENPSVVAAAPFF